MLVLLSVAVWSGSVRRIVGCTFFTHANSGSNPHTNTTVSYTASSNTNAASDACSAASAIVQQCGYRDAGECRLQRGDWLGEHAVSK